MGLAGILLAGGGTMEYLGLYSMHTCRRLKPPFEGIAIAQTARVTDRYMDDSIVALTFSIFKDF